MPTARNDIRVVLFDVGGVLVELSGLATMMSWLGDRHTTEELYTLWLTSPLVRAFETGKMEPETFADQLIAQFALPVDRQEFFHHFCSWTRRLFPGAIELVNSVPRQYVRATLCNTNALHWPCLLQESELLNAFDHHFASHLIGKIKPDEAAFQYVVDTLGCEPAEIVFMDDSRLNVAGAKKVGLKAFQVKSPAEAEQVLREVCVLRV